jgi:hypothetical protein
MTLESRLAEALLDEVRPDADVGSLEAELLAAPDCDAILDGLSRHRSPLVRGWTSGIARKLRNDRNLPLMRRLAADRDPDVRNIAFQDIAAQWPSELAVLLPRLRRELDGENAVQALWMIAEARDPESRVAVQHVAVDDQRPPYVRSLAGIVLSVLDGDLTTILRRISTHDHDSMHWLVQAAGMLDANGAEPTLLDFIRRAPDPSCRHYCEMALRSTPSA